jgi:histone H3/H4
MNDIIPKARLKYATKNVASDSRISDDSLDLVNEYITNKTEELLQDAYVYCKHAGRRTILDKDVKLAIKYAR